MQKVESSSLFSRFPKAPRPRGFLCFRPMDTPTNLDDPARIDELRRLILRKPALRRLYAEVYEKYAECLARCPSDGIAVELGAGPSFVKDTLPEVVTSDTIPYDGVDTVVDAMDMPYEDGELRALFLMNVFHHIPDVGKFLSEAQRCLRPGGRVYMFDEYPGWISTPILKHGHYEPFEPDAEEWSFASTGPLSGANGALAWIVFKRDRAIFDERYPQLRLDRFDPCVPLRYWTSGGLKKWTLVPGPTFGAATWLDERIISISPRFGSFADIEIVKT